MQSARLLVKVLREDADFRVRVMVASGSIVFVVLEPNYLSAAVLCGALLLLVPRSIHLLRDRDGVARVARPHELD
ncbi:MAG TPA: hypothetical protein VGC04_14435 [Cellulomonas sp.]